MTYYQRIGSDDNRKKVVGFGRDVQHPYRIFNGKEFTTNIFEVMNNGSGQSDLHGKIYDPSELSIIPPYPDFVKIGEITYKRMDGQKPVIDPFKSTTYTFNEKRSLSNTGPHKKIESDFTGNRGNWGLVKNQFIDTPRYYPYTLKDQPQNNNSGWKITEQSSMFSQMIRRGFFNQGRLTSMLDMQTGEIRKSEGVAFVGEKLENVIGNKDSFFLDPNKRPPEVK
jgi:hypothetical protein